MDLCHCNIPDIKRHVAKDGSLGDWYCARCGLWFVRSSWEKDPRRIEAAKLHRRENPPSNTVRRPLSVGIDPYSPCPCGSGKKRRFCKHV